MLITSSSNNLNFIPQKRNTVGTFSMSLLYNSKKFPPQYTVRQNTLPSSSTSNLFPLTLETTEQYTDKDKEYVPLLTSHHLIDNLESDIAEDEEEDTRSVHKGRCRLAKVVQLPPPPNFEHFVHLRPLH